MMRRILTVLGVTALTLAGVTGVRAAEADRERAGDAPGAVYALTNAPAGDAVVAFDRAADGSLQARGTYSTGGRGSGAGLGSQGAVIVSDDHRLLFAVNAGDNSISSFRIEPDGLMLVDRQPSGGVLPTSLTYRHGLLFVLNAGAPNSVNGFRVSAKGAMRAIPGSSRPLSTAQTAPGQVGFSSDGDTLIVTEKGTNVVDTYEVDDDGRLEGPFIHPSAGPTPFGFATGRRGVVLVSEAGAGGGASTYRADEERLTPVSSMLMTGQRAACWAVITNNGRFGYVSNAGTGNISGFTLASDGTAALLNADGVSATTGGNPSDMVLSNDGGLLYVRIAARNEIALLTVGPDGALASRGAAAVIPAGAAGLTGF